MIGSVVLALLWAWPLFAQSKTYFRNSLSSSAILNPAQYYGFTSTKVEFNFDGVTEKKTTSREFTTTNQITEITSLTKEDTQLSVKGEEHSLYFVTRANDLPLSLGITYRDMEKSTELSVPRSETTVDSEIISSDPQPTISDSRDEYEADFHVSYDLDPFAIGIRGRFWRHTSTVEPGYHKDQITYGALYRNSLLETGVALRTTMNKPINQFYTQADPGGIITHITGKAGPNLKITLAADYTKWSSVESGGKDGMTAIAHVAIKLAMFKWESSAKSWATESDIIPTVKYTGEHQSMHHRLEFKISSYRIYLGIRSSKSTGQAVDPAGTFTASGSGSTSSSEMGISTNL